MLGDQLFAYGALIAGSCVLIVLAETPLAIMLGKHPALRLVSSGWALVGLGFVALSLWPALGGAIIGVFVITIGEMLYKPTAPAFVTERAPEGMAGRFQSLYSAASISGMVLSPPVGGFLYQYAPGLLWPVSCALAFGAAATLGVVAGKPG
jgi:MFS family permease